MEIVEGGIFDVVKTPLVLAGVDKEEDFLRGGTPERAEFENSIADEAAQEDQLSEIDEDEWTETNNFAISNNSSSGGASSLDSRYFSFPMLFYSISWYWTIDYKDFNYPLTTSIIRNLTNWLNSFQMGCIRVHFYVLSFINICYCFY